MTSRSSRTQRLFETAFHIHPDEIKIVHAFFFYFLSVGMFGTFGETFSNTIFLARVGSQEAERLLPWSYVWTAVGALALTSIYDFLQSKVSRTRLIIGTHLVLAVSVVFFRQAVFLESRWVYFSLIIWMDLCTMFNFVVLFSCVGDYFTTSDARRLVGYISGGLALGTVLAGYAADFLAEAIGADTMLYGCAALMASGAGFARIIFRMARPVTQTDAEEDTPQAPLKSVFSSRYIQLAFIAGLMACICMAVADFELKVVASREMTEIQLASFFGKLYAAVGMASLVVEFGLVGWLLKRFGITRSLTLLPALVVVSHALFFAFPTVLVAAGLNFIILSLLDTLDSPAREVLFLPLPSRVRVRAQALSDGAIEPLGSGLGGIVLLVLGGLLTRIEYLAPVAMLLGCLWIVFIFLLGPQYRQVLADSLRKKRFTPLDMNALMKNQESLAAFSGLLGSSDPQLVLSALFMLKGGPLEKFTGLVAKLTTSENGEVAAEAFRLLGTSRDRSHTPTLVLGLNDSRPEVQSAAILALCQILEEDAVALVSPFVDSGEASVRRDVLLGSALYCGFEGALLAFPRLDCLIRSSVPEERREAAMALGQIGASGALHVGKALEGLLEDPEKSVRKEAILASALVREPRLIPRLTDQMRDVNLRPLVLQALNDMPREAIHKLIEVMRDLQAGCNGNGIPSMILLPGLAKAIGNVGGPDAVRTLWNLIGSDEDLVLQLSVSHTLRRLKLREGLHDMALDGFDEVFARACEKAQFTASVQDGIRDIFPASHAFFADQLRLQLGFIMALLSLRYDTRQIRHVESHLFGSNQVLKANATELLELVLPRNVAESVLPLVNYRSECSPLTETGLGPETLTRLLGSDSWTRAVTIFSVTEGGPLPESIGGSLMTTRDEKMHKVVTTISFLKQVSLFQDVPANYLASLAEIVEEKSFFAGEKLFSQGDAGDSLYLICEGHVKVLVGNTEVALLGPKECIGEMALLDQQARSATAVVEKDARLLRISSEDFSDLLASQPAILRSLLQTITRRLRDTLTMTSH